MNAAKPELIEAVWAHGRVMPAAAQPPALIRRERAMIRKLPSGQYRLYSRRKNPKTGRRRNLGTFGTRGEAEQHERAVQFFKRHG